MKRQIRTILLAGMMLCTTSCGGGGNISMDSTANQSDTTSNAQSQFVFDMEGIKPESLSTIWMCPKSLDNGALIPGFADDLTNKENWPTLMQTTGTLKLYIEQISKTSKPDLRKIADFVRENKLSVAVELGGARAASTDTSDDQMGKDAAEREFLVLSKFLMVGGRIDYISTDHALASEITDRTNDRPNMTLQQWIQQQMEYYRYMLDLMPNLKVGAIESLGFFWVKGSDRQYAATDPTLKRVDFEEYMSELVRIAKENNITIDHFHIDFGMHDIEYDKGYGRVLAVEDYVHSLGVKSGFIAGNAFHLGSIKLDTAENIARANQSAAERTLKYFEGYMEAGGRSDYLLFQRWQQVPVAVGNENMPLSSFGIYKSLLDSKWFPKS